MRIHRLLLVFSKNLLAIVLLLNMSFAQAVVNSTQSRLVFNEDSIAETLVLVNSQRSPALIQLWSDDNDPLAPPDRINTPLIVVPPVFKLAAGESRNIRVMLFSRKGMPEDREKVYWLNIYQIPPNTRSESAEDKKVILPLRIRLKVFVRPYGLQEPDEDTGKALLFSLKDDDGQKRSLLIENPTSYYQTISRIRLGEHSLTPVMVEPKSSATLSVPPGGHDRGLNWSVIDDFGNQKRYHRQI